MMLRNQEKEILFKIINQLIAKISKHTKIKMAKLSRKAKKIVNLILQLIYFRLYSKKKSKLKTSVLNQQYFKKILISKY